MTQVPNHLPVIAPSILNADLGRLEEQIVRLKEAGASLLHLDVMDGTFVPPISFGTNIVQLAKKHFVGGFIESHLMVAHPERHIDAFIDAGSDRVIIHLEATSHVHRVLEAIKNRSCSCGIAINPGTPVALVADVLALCDLLLIMTVNPGWGGQSFIPHSLRKIEAARQMIDSDELIAKNKSDVLIEVDGGIKPDTAALCVKSGATLLVVGSYLFTSADPKIPFQTISNALSTMT